jgi:CheY-like chemotaxis protein
MLLITIETAGQQRQYLHDSGPLVLGRQPSGDEAHLVIDEDYISRRHLVLEEVSSQPFDVLLMDVEMPEMDGLAAVREIRRREHAQGRRTPIVAVTAHRSDESRAECLAAGVDAVLVKPISKHDLDEVIARLAAASPP